MPQGLKSHLLLERIMDELKLVPFKHLLRITSSWQREESGRASPDTHLRRDEAAPKMEHPDLWLMALLAWGVGRV
jgi:hypothetical protein